MTETVSPANPMTAMVTDERLRDLDWTPEAQCRICGDYKHEAASGCRESTGHEFEATGRRLLIVTPEEITKILALPAPPQNTDGEAVAWKWRYSARYRLKPEDNPWRYMDMCPDWLRDGRAEIEPLFASPPASLLSTLKAERDALAKALEDMGRGWIVDRARSTLKGDAP